MGTGDWLGNPGFGGFSDCGDICVSSGTRIVFGARIFIRVNHRLTKLFWSGDAYFGNQDGTYISYLHFSIPRYLVSLA